MGSCWATGSAFPDFCIPELRPRWGSSDCPLIRHSKQQGERHCALHISDGISEGLSYLGAWGADQSLRPKWRRRQSKGQGRAPGLLLLQHCPVPQPAPSSRALTQACPAPHLHTHLGSKPPLEESQPFHLADLSQISAAESHTHSTIIPTPVHPQSMLSPSSPAPPRNLQSDHPSFCVPTALQPLHPTTPLPLA